MDLSLDKTITQTSYDKIPYESHSFPQTHPDRFASVGHLFGLTITSVAHCRVLELGCRGVKNHIN